ncbi:Opacity protein [Ferrimonas sediminum]|uniref:Opacity protein n=1 Tax=Ferrimonas sediminum TaxID=718193 RepID=A0A1G8TTF8_9GAMM|nr:porin family protein [Ferrimonas sediminum]SDJ44866.1 Opacity protein [Ferrimonas sediminum]
MKKLTLSLITAALLSTPAMAANIDWFVGAGAGWQQDSISGDASKDSDDVTWQFRGGMVLNDHHRFSGSYSYKEDTFNVGDERFKQEQNMFLASYDYLIPVGASEKMNLFAGVSAGLADNKLAGNAHTNFVWGGQVGAEYRFTQHWSSEIGYRYLDQDYEEMGKSVNGTFALDDTQQLYVSFDYRF